MVVHFCQHQARLRRGMQGKAGFQIALGFAPQLFLRGKFAQIHQQACVFGVVFEPCVARVNGFLLAAVVQITHAGNEWRQQVGIARGGVMGVYPCDGLVV